MITNDNGNAEITVYKILEGVEICYNSIHTNSFQKKGKSNGIIIEINYCREGRLEQHIGNEFYYLMPGDLSVTWYTENDYEYSFPLNHYHGIGICIDTVKAPECLSEIMPDIDIYPIEIVKRLCGESRCFVIRSEQYAEHILSELYSIPDCHVNGYLKIKFLELFLVLNSFKSKQKSKEIRPISETGVSLAKKTAEYIRSMVGEKISVVALAREMNVSQTYLQNVFKSVYGVPIYTYLKIFKMQAAAFELIRSNRTVMDIASQFGYDNASKFSYAFNDIMGASPSEYRKMNGKRS